MNDRSEPFFLWVWRINGLLLLGLALLGVAGALALVFSFGGVTSLESPEDQLTEVAGADLGAQGLRLADFRTIAGSPLLYAPLAPPYEYIGSGSGESFEGARNLLFFDTTTKKAHWLLPDNDRAIPSFSFLMDPPGQRYDEDDGEARERKQVAIALLVEIEEKKPRESVAAVPRSLALASPDGRTLTPLAQSTQGLLGYHHARKDSLLVFYVVAGAARVLDVDPITRSVRSDEPLGTQEP